MTAQMMMVTTSQTIVNKLSPEDTIFVMEIHVSHLAFTIAAICLKFLILLETWSLSMMLFALDLNHVIVL